MALAYRPPGVSVEEDLASTISPLLSAPALICLVGLTQGFQSRTDQFILSGTGAIPLPGLPSGSTLQEIVTVRDALNPSMGATDGSGYVLTTDYTVPGQTNEVQLVTVTGTPTGGNFTLSFNNQTTSNIAYNAASSAVQTALQSLSTIGAGNATVSGSAGGPYTVTFTGALAGAPQALLVPSAALTGGTSPNVTVAESTGGSGGGTIARNSSGTIPDGALVNVTYTYVPNNYYEPIRLFDLGSVESRFGTGLNAQGTAINSPLSYAASVAFENGASSVVCQPLLKRATPGDPLSAAGQPNSTQVANTSTWADTLYVLRDIEDINVIVPIIGQSAANVGDSTMLNIFQVLQDHTYFMKQQDQLLVDIFGEDSSSSIAAATDSVIQSHANTLRGRYGGDVAEQTVLINTSRFTRSLPGIGQTLTVGGQYAAAAVAGMLSSRPASSSLTRKIVSGFLGITDSRSLSEKNADAAAGLLVLEQKGQNVVVRHSITLDQTNAARRELSVVRAKHRVVESVKDTLDRQIIGQIIADSQAPLTVSATVTAVLEQLKAGRDIVDYSSVQSRLTSLDPTTIEVRFAYRPSFPLNYIDVIFALDLSAGSITTNTLTGV